MLVAESVDASAKKTAADMGAPLEMVSSLKMEGRAGMTIGKTIAMEDKINKEADEQRKVYAEKAEALFNEVAKLTAADVTTSAEVKSNQMAGLKELQHARALELMQQVAALKGKLTAPKHISILKEVQTSASQDLTTSESS